MSALVTFSVAVFGGWWGEADKSNLTVCFGSKFEVTLHPGGKVRIARALGSWLYHTVKKQRVMDTELSSLSSFLYHPSPLNGNTHNTQKFEHQLA